MEYFFPHHFEDKLIHQNVTVWILISGLQSDPRGFQVARLLFQAGVAPAAGSLLSV